jgi:hypothetical protein
MPLPNSLHGNEYWENLSTLRDEALVNSNAYGQRRRVGRLAFGHAHAQWEAETGGAVHLDDEGVRIGDTTLLNFHPTTMRIFDNHGSEGTEVVTFRMDIDDIGDIEVFRHMITSASFLEVVRNEMSKRADRRHDMAVPTDEELTLVYTEMERGASGLYAPGQQPPQRA